MRLESFELTLAAGLPKYTGVRVPSAEFIMSATSLARIMVGYEARPGDSKK